MSNKDIDTQLRLVVLAFLTIVLAAASAVLGLPETVAEPTGTSSLPITVMLTTQKGQPPVGVQLDIWFADPVAGERRAQLSFNELDEGAPNQTPQQIYLGLPTSLVDDLDCDAELQSLDSPPDDFPETYSLGNSDSLTLFATTTDARCSLGVDDFLIEGKATMIMGAPDVLVAYAWTSAPAYFLSSDKTVPANKLPSASVNLWLVPTNWQVITSSSPGTELLAQRGDRRNYYWEAASKYVDNLMPNTGAYRAIQTPTAHLVGTSVVGAAQQTRGTYYSGVLLGLAGSCALLAFETVKWARRDDNPLLVLPFTPPAASSEPTSTTDAPAEVADRPGRVNRRTRLLTLLAGALFGFVIGRRR